MTLVVFDVDGTLTGTSAVDDACLVQAFADAFGIARLDTDWSRYDDASDPGIARAVLEEHLGRAPGAEEIADVAERFVRRLQQHYASAAAPCDEIPGARALIRKLRQEPRWGVAIATGSWERSARCKIRAAGFRVDGIPAAFGEDGPSRESIVRTAVARAAERYRRRRFGRIVSVGDAIWDLGTAKRLELPFVGIADGERAETLRSAGASHVIGDFLDDRLCLSCLEQATIPR